MWGSLRTLRLFIAINSVVTLAIGNLSAAVALTKPFLENMVLQRNMMTPIWGTAAVGEDVTVTFRSKEVTTKTGADGKWTVKVESGDASAIPLEIVIKGSNTITIKNVLVGEVWLAGGQSNMEFTMKSIAGPNTDSIKFADFPNIRLYTQRDDKGWRPCDTNTVKDFSATGYYFAKNLYQSLKIPIGVISSNVGGTEVERWMDPATVAATMPGDTDTWHSGLYNQFIKPLIPYGIRGAIWYQGESDAFPDTRNPHPADVASKYRQHFGDMITGWRKVWGQGDFPFYYVQLANYMALQTVAGENSDWAVVREAQRLTLTVKNTGMAVIIDIGEAGDIHPKNKWDVGKRLALNARAQTYKEKDLVYSSPIFRAKEIRGKNVRCTFYGAEGGLKYVGGSKLTGFALAGADNKWYFADATLEKDTVVVSSASVPIPLRVRYAWANNPTCNLYNAAGLPASPFQTDGEQIPVALAPMRDAAGRLTLRGVKPVGMLPDALGRRPDAVISVSGIRLGK